MAGDAAFSTGDRVEVAGFLAVAALSRDSKPSKAMHVRLSRYLLLFEKKQKSIETDYR